MPKIVDATGQRYGRLVALRNTRQIGTCHGYIWEFQCDCGNITAKELSVVKSGGVKSCGCALRNKKPNRKRKPINEVTVNKDEMIKGVRLQKTYGRTYYRASMVVGKTKVLDKTFTTYEEACAARREAEKKLKNYKKKGPECDY